ncbi:MAG: hypothetical protein DIZ80_12730 [endosymbiont of Galathealinum brachiosum]|uniref:DUF1585 domain-containing protein n=1 Tax=endosymbiont of Galathealinum brachiosum TaxID=2200906 RepID=A0A370DDX8_9GAMM|nr:MAG: hypothetical protein DIZ80_12730 [endosymbiont of Galathealinum brachiosum]
MPLSQQNQSKSILSSLTCAGRLSVVISLLISSLAQAGVTERDEARRIHDRLTGIAPTNSVLTTMEGQILAGDAEAAAFEAMKNPAFYNVTLKNYAAPWTNEAQSVFVPLNDYTATVIGLIRDDIDFRQVLSGNIIYTGAGVTPSYSNANNDHYEALEQLGPVSGDLSNGAILQQRVQSDVTGLPASATAGVMTTRAAAEAFFKDGTNRAMFRFTFMNHLCTDLEPLKDVSRVPDMVRQDVSRSPGGDSRIYMFSCVGCHAGMDGLGGAYAMYNFNTDTQQMDYARTDAAALADTSLNGFVAGGLSAKYHNNSDNFKPGFIATDDKWVNYWRNGQNKLLGWSETPSDPGIVIDARGHASGNGAKSMGSELADSNAFASCQVKKAFQTVCLRNSDDYSADRSIVDSITADFKGADNYQMKSVFAKVAAYCK